MPESWVFLFPYAATGCLHYAMVRWIGLVESFGWAPGWDRDSEMEYLMRILHHGVLWPWAMVGNILGHFLMVVTFQDHNWRHFRAISCYIVFAAFPVGLVLLLLELSN